MTVHTLPRTAFCSACMRFEMVDHHWLALYIDGDGRLICAEPERGCDIDYERPGTVFACGQGSALVLFERYLHARSFRIAHNIHLNHQISEIHA